MRNCSSTSRAVMRKSLLLRWHLNLNEHSTGGSGEWPGLGGVDLMFGEMTTWKSRLTFSTNAANSGEAQTRGSSELGGTAISASKGTWS